MPSWRALQAVKTTHTRAPRNEADTNAGRQMHQRAEMLLKAGAGRGRAMITVQVPVAGHCVLGLTSRWHACCLPRLLSLSLHHRCAAAGRG